MAKVLNAFFTQISQGRRKRTELMSRGSDHAYFTPLVFAMAGGMGTAASTVYTKLCTVHSLACIHVRYATYTGEKQFTRDLDFRMLHIYTKGSLPLKRSYRFQAWKVAMARLTARLHYRTILERFPHNRSKSIQTPVYTVKMQTGPLRSIS